jgi:superfamily II DNA or RNA helicase
MRDIELYDDGRIVFCKKLWHLTEITLAKCYGFDIDENNEKITCHLMKTSKISVYDFIRLSFKSFSESFDNTARRNDFYSRLEIAYSYLENEALKMMQTLPYYNKLYAHQKEGIYFGLTHRVNLLAFQMRLGKSITSASLSRLLSIPRTVIICPAIAKWGWFRDLTSDTWGYNPLFFTMLDAKKSKTFKALNERFIIINYDILKNNMEHLLSSEVGHFIIDECHRIKSRTSNRSKVLQDITDRFPNAKITLLSGTPIPNRFDDLFNYFKLTKHPLGESYKKFTDEYCVKTTSRGGEKVTGARNIQDLKTKMSNFMLIKRMDDCFDMPADVISRYTFQLDDYREEYDKVIEEMANQKSAAALRGNLHTLNIITCKSKMPGMIEAIEEIIAENGKVVVFGSYKEPLKMLEDYFKERCVKVDGSTPSFDRDALKQEFWKNDKVEVFLGNYLVAGEALDLSISSDVFCINFPMTPREIYQALFRCKHPEKKSHLRIHFTFCEESVDEDLYDLVIDKEKDINVLMTDGKEVIERENISEILIKRILEKNNKNANVETINFMDISEEEYSEEGRLDNSNEEQNDLQDKTAERENSRGTEGVGQVILRNVPETNDFAKTGQYYIAEDIEKTPLSNTSISESFEDMQQLVQHMNDNGSQFIPNEPKGVVTDDMVKKSWEHFEKNKVKPAGHQVTLEEGIEEAEKNDGIAFQIKENHSSNLPTFTLPDFD